VYITAMKSKWWLHGLQINARPRVRVPIKLMISRQALDVCMRLIPILSNSMWTC
jgi:hypothetical protein